MGLNRVFQQSVHRPQKNQKQTQSTQDLEVVKAGNNIDMLRIMGFIQVRM